MPEVEAEEVAEEVADVFRAYGLAESQIAPLVDVIRADRDRWIDFMMRFELGLEMPDPTRARNSALTIAISYIAGGLIPLAPYIVVSSVSTALWASVGMTLTALAIFGVVKGRLTGLSPLRGGLQTALTGGLAAAAAFAIARAIG